MWTSNDRETEPQIEDSSVYFGGRVELYQVHNFDEERRYVADLARR